MTIERDQALDEIFDGPAARKRSTADAAELAADRLEVLTAALMAGHELGDEYGTDARREADVRIREAAISIGRDALDGMRGMILACVVDPTTVMPRREDGDFAPLDDSWQKEGDPYRDAAEIAAKQRERFESQSKQPNQLYRRLAEVVALGADLGGWTAWTLL